MTTLFLFNCISLSSLLEHKSFFALKAGKIVMHQKLLVTTFSMELSSHQELLKCIINSNVFYVFFILSYKSMRVITPNILKLNIVKQIIEKNMIHWSYSRVESVLPAYVDEVYSILGGMISITSYINYIYYEIKNINTMYWFSTTHVLITFSMNITKSLHFIIIIIFK